MTWPMSNDRKSAPFLLGPYLIWGLDHQIHAMRRSNSQHLQAVLQLTGQLATLGWRMEGSPEEMRWSSPKKFWSQQLLLVKEDPGEVLKNRGRTRARMETVGTRNSAQMINHLNWVKPLQTTVELTGQASKPSSWWERRRRKTWQKIPIRISNSILAPEHGAWMQRKIGSRQIHSRADQQYSSLVLVDMQS